MLSTIVNTLLTTMLMGLWFGIRLNTLVWGIYFAAFILLERYFLMRFLEKMPPIVDRIYTFIVVMFSFTIFSGSSLRVTAYYIKSMFGLNHLPFANSAVSYILTTNYLLLLCSFFCATSLSSLVGKFVHNKLPRHGGFAGYRGVSGGVCSGSVILRLTICQREVDGYAFTQTTAGGKKKMLPGLLLALLLGAGGVWALAAGEGFPHYNRYYTLGEYLKEVEQAMAENLPFSRQLSELAVQLKMAGGAKEFDGIFVGDDILIEDIGQPNQRQTEQNIQTLTQFSQSSRIPTYFMLLPTKCATNKMSCPPASHCSTKSSSSNRPIIACSVRRPSWTFIRHCLQNLRRFVLQRHPHR